LKPHAKVANARIIVGTVKSMFPVYGIDVLIQSFAKVYSKLVGQDANWKEQLGLRIVGGGDFLDRYRQLSRKLGIAEVTEFVGQVSHARVPEELTKIDVFVALSRSESFGVAAIEAGAAGLPVVVSEAEGLREVVLENQTGLIVPIEDIAASAAAIERLIMNGALRDQLGRQGREFVFANYSWSSNVQQMIRVYEQTLARFSGRGRNVPHTSSPA
jgi:glycosyltransferase involved in cell wall biosynthesis